MQGDTKPEMKSDDKTKLTGDKGRYPSRERKPHKKLDDYVVYKDYDDDDVMYKVETHNCDH